MKSKHVMEKELILNDKAHEPEHVMAKELILNDKAHEKLEYNKCLKVSEVEPLLIHFS